MINSDKPIAFFDIETTGLNVKTDRIVEISLVQVLPFLNECDIDANGIVKPPITYRLNPEMHIPEAASEVHGIYDENVVACPAFKDIAGEIFAIVSSCHIAGFNSNSYDIPILYNELLRAGIEWDYSDCKFIDVGNLYKIMEPRTLEAAYKFYCDSFLADAHHAQADVYATIRVFNKMQEKYIDLPVQVDELAIFSNFGKKMLDISNYFSLNNDGQIIFNFGKHRNELALNHVDYLNWMLNSDFPADTKRIITKLLNNSIGDLNG